MKTQILQKHGFNNTDTLSFTLAKNNEPYGLYTYQNEVCVLKNGSDLDWEDLTPEEQVLVHGWVMADLWTISDCI